MHSLHDMINYSKTKLVNYSYKRSPISNIIKWSRTRLWYSGMISFLYNVIWLISLTGEVIGWWSRYDIYYTIWYIVVILDRNLKVMWNHITNFLLYFFCKLIIFQFIYILYYIRWVLTNNAKAILLNISLLLGNGNLIKVIYISG